MGLVTFGIPREITLQLARAHGATAFVETGTFRGETTRWAAEHFERVHTIERSAELHAEHGPELDAVDGITTHLGDSRDVLPGILGDLGDRRAVHWLDGHWSGDDVTAGNDDECPLLDELALLVDRPDDIVLIDDAHFFLSAPPPPYDPGQWPTIADVTAALPGEPYVQIVDDVLLAVPRSSAARESLMEHARSRSESFWGYFTRLQRGEAGPRGRIRRLLARFGV